MALHTGFGLPNAPKGAPLRESIETEALLYFEGDQVSHHSLGRTSTNCVIQEIEAPV